MKLKCNHGNYTIHIVAHERRSFVAFGVVSSLKCLVLYLHWGLHHHYIIIILCRYGDVSRTLVR